MCTASGCRILPCPGLYRDPRWASVPLAFRRDPPGAPDASPPTRLHHDLRVFQIAFSGQTAENSSTRLARRGVDRATRLPPEAAMATMMKSTNPSFRFRPLSWLVWACGLAAINVWTPPIAAGAGELTGEKVYAAKCARCHGPQGEGTAKHPEVLAGELSVAQLADLVGETMPEDDPGSLAAEEAQAVAAFVHGTFYSSVARQRSRPARIELARLTVSQYRATLADLTGSFRETPEVGADRGLKGEYYSGRRIGGRRERAASRVDARIDFDFGTAAPVPEIKEPHEFSIRWEGSLLAAETGEYEFVVRTEHAARLWLNDQEHPLIDAWVKSGDDTQFRASLTLLGGRAYPLRLDFTKAKQGVDDSKKQKKTPPSRPASIALLWKRPGGVLTPIPQRNLAPEIVPESYVCATRFPPDDRSYGWVRGTSVSKAWDQATTEAAIETAGYVWQHIDRLAGTRPEAADREDKLRTFCRTFADRAFRRPLGEAESQLFVDRQFEAAADPRMAVKRVVLLVLKSPRFLFREVGGGPAAGGDDHADVAARLAFGLWDSLPDAVLRQAAAAGQLGTPAEIAAQAERMLDDPRARAKLHEFLLTWLQVETHQELSKDDQRFPGFDPAAAADLRTSLELFLDEILGAADADYRRLLLADEVFLNDRLARLYGGEAVDGADFVKVRLDGGKRAGILTHPYLLANFAYARESSPIHRGVFLARGILGQTMRPPPEAFAPLAAELHPELTTRERVSLQTRPASCMTCHGLINPLGFTLEHFDAIGRYRELDREKPIDDAGSYRTRAGDTVALRGARELAEFLANSAETQAAFTEQLFHHLVQQPVRAYGPTMLDDLRRGFATDEFNIRKLVVRVMVATARAGRESQVAVNIDE